jgi:hypothetical protein
MTCGPRLALACACCAAALRARAEGRFELSQGSMPVTITNSGSYIVTENLAFAIFDPVTLIASKSTWKYLDDGSDQGTNWLSPGFDDSAWKSSGGAFGYGDPDLVTTVSYGPNPNNRYMTTYFRRSFPVTNAMSFVDLDLWLRRDDGVVLYLNGVEVGRDNMPTGVVTYLTPAAADIPNGDQETNYYELDILHTLLVDGTNVLAAEVHQFSGNSADLDFDAGLIGDTNIAFGSGPGITIAADHVTLDLNGHVLRGILGLENDGIFVANANNVTIRNGTITGWGDDGIDAFATTNLLVEDIRAHCNGDDGIIGGVAAMIQDCVSSWNGVNQTVSQNDHGNGIKVEINSLVRNCRMHGNNNHGADTASSVEVLDSMIAWNEHDGIHGGQGNIVGRCNQYRMLDEGMEVNVGSVTFDSVSSLGGAASDGFKARDETPPTPEGRCVFARCMALENGSDGIKGEDGSIIAWCNATGNSDDGISGESYCLIVENLATRNGFVVNSTPGGGIGFDALHNVACENHVVANRLGITTPLAAGVSNLVFRNAAAGSLTNYALRPNNVVGPLTNSAATRRAWANFRLGN